MRTPPSTTDLRSLARARTLVRVHRAALEEGHADGRIVGCSAKLVALAILDEGIRPNGFKVFRRADISQLEAPAPYADFKREALRLRKDKLPPIPKLDLSSWSSVVSTAARRFPLVPLHMERKDPDVCYIGKPVQLNARRGTFVTISPAAQWDPDDPLVLAWADVTRVDFGGAYEEALALVAAERA